MPVLEPVGTDSDGFGLGAKVKASFVIKNVVNYSMVLCLWVRK